MDCEYSSGTMLRGLKAHHNMFWESVRNFYLEGLLNRAYQDPSRKRLIQKWLRGKEGKKVLVVQWDFYSDPFLIGFYPEGWETRILEEEPIPSAEVELRCTHTGLIALTDRLSSFILGWLRGEFQLPLFFKKLRDHYYALRIFLER